MNRRQDCSGFCHGPNGCQICNSWRQCASWSAIEDCRISSCKPVQKQHVSVQSVIVSIVLNARSARRFRFELRADVDKRNLERLAETAIERARFSCSSDKLLGDIGVALEAAWICSSIPKIIEIMEQGNPGFSKKPVNVEVARSFGKGCDIRWDSKAEIQEGSQPGIYV